MARTLVAAAFLMFCAAVVEAGSYVTLHVLKSRYVTPFTQGISVTGRPPNSRVTFRSGPIRVDYVLNDLGFRGPRWTLEKAPGTYRIAVFGDSFADGWGLEQEAMFSYRLQGMLDRAHGAGKFEVGSFAIQGSGPGTAYKVYLDIARRFTPDLVVLGIFVGNDFVDAETELARGLQLEDRNPVKLRRGVPFSYQLFSLLLAPPNPEQTELEQVKRAPGYRTLDPELKKMVEEGTLHIALLRFGLTSPDAIEKALTQITPHQAESFVTVVKRFAEATMADRAKFLMFAIPMSVQVSREQFGQLRRMHFQIPDSLVGSRLPQDLIARSLEPWIDATPERMASVTYLDPFAEFEARSRAEPLYLAYDAHVNANGHRLIAEILLRAITEHYALPGPILPRPQKPRQGENTRPRGSPAPRRSA